IVLVARLVAALAGARAGAFAALAWATLHSHAVLLAWAACAQDLLATALGLVCATAFVRGHRRTAAVALFAGLLAKESIAPLPLALAAWWAAERAGPVTRRLREGLAATAPLWGAVVAW